MGNESIDFIAYCIEEYKFANKISGEEVIKLFKQYDIITYIKTCYGALHTMGGLAIAEDINLLIAGAHKGNSP
jgi:predicted nucleotide-binding protein (sugar kinase/HSP70/actin superfamily)